MAPTQACPPQVGVPQFADATAEFQGRAATAAAGDRQARRASQSTVHDGAAPQRQDGPQPPPADGRAASRCGIRAQRAHALRAAAHRQPETGRQAGVNILPKDTKNFIALICLAQLLSIEYQIRKSFDFFHFIPSDFPLPLTIVKIKLLACIRSLVTL